MFVAYISQIGGASCVCVCVCVYVCLVGNWNRKATRKNRDDSSRNDNWIPSICVYILLFRMVRRT